MDFFFLSFSLSVGAFCSSFGALNCENVHKFVGQFSDFVFVSRAMGEGEGGGDCVQKNASLSEVVAPSAASLEVPAKKLARQLDFTGAPEHPPQLPVAVLPLPLQLLISLTF